MTALTHRGGREPPYPSHPRKARRNKIWAHDLRFSSMEGHATEMFNAMKQGSDLGVKQAIEKMPAESQAAARRFVETDNQLKDLTNRMDKLQWQIEHADIKEAKYDRPGSTVLPGEKSNYSEKLLTLPTDKPPMVVAAENAYNDFVKRMQQKYLAGGQWTQKLSQAEEVQRQGLSE